MGPDPDRAAKTLRNWEIVYGDTTSKQAFAAYIVSFNVLSVPLDAPLRGEVTLRISGAVTETF